MEKLSVQIHLWIKLSDENVIKFQWAETIFIFTLQTVTEFWHFVETVNWCYADLTRGCNMVEGIVWIAVCWEIY